ncbi:MAG: hypothetical protein K2X27_22410 [Candidatus Obscuribacterales bacterium]|nr:hypothetical protein [Candidatus Obscuribacterales bacterium]
MKTRKLRKREFARSVRNGLGSAYLHVKEYGDKGVEEELLNACLTNHVYDRQINSGRADWIASMLDATGRSKIYALEIARALNAKSKQSDSDFEQLVELASKLFDRGLDEFKGVLLNLVSADEAPAEPLILGEALVDVAGISGFEIAARMMAKGEVSNCEKQALFKYACESIESEAELTEILKERADFDPLLSRFWLDVQIEMADCENASRRATRPSLTYDQLIDAIEKQAQAERLPGIYRSFGRSASHEDLIRVLSRLEKETEPSRLCAYLSVFWARPLPAVSKKIIGLLFCEDANLRRSTRNALSNVQSLRVRRAALKALKSEDGESLLCGIELLKPNYKPQDLDLLTKSLKSIKEIDYLHWAAMSAIGIAEASDDIRLSSLLAWIYEFTPCGNCRGAALKQMIEWETTPTQILHEAQWDAESQIRRMARSALA